MILIFINFTQSFKTIFCVSTCQLEASNDKYLSTIMDPVTGHISYVPTKGRGTTETYDRQINK